MWINDMARGRARRKFGLFAVMGLTASAFALIYFGPSASADPGGEPLPGSVTTQLMGPHDLSATAEPGVSTTTKLIKEAPPLPKDAAAQAELQETVDAAADKVDAIASTEAGAG